MAAFLDVCRFTPTAGGTADWAYSFAVAGYQSPAAAGVVNGRAYKYRAESADLSQWELGEGTYNTGTGVLTRTTVLYNSSGTGTGPGQSGAGSKINFSAAPQVAVVALKEDLIAVEEANSFTTTQKGQAASNIGLGTGDSVLFDMLRFNRAVEISGNDLNSLTTSGWYSGASLTNAPGGSTSYFYVEVIQINQTNGYALQRAWLIALGDAVGWYRTQEGGSWTGWRLIATPKRRYIDGLTLSTAGSSSTFTVAPGEAVDDNQSDRMVLPSSLSKTTSSWTVGNNNGGLDTGTIAANTWYHAYLIKRLDTFIVDALVSLSASSPTLPTGYTIARRIGSMKTDGSSNWTAFTQLGEEFLWKTGVADVATTNPGTSAVTPTLSVPTGIQVRAKVNVHVSSTSTTTQMLVTSPDENDQTPSTSVFTVMVNSNGFGSTTHDSTSTDIRTNTSAQVRYRLSASASNVAVNIFTRGWFDRRGVT